MVKISLETERFFFVYIWAMNKILLLIMIVFVVGCKKDEVKNYELAIYFENEKPRTYNIFATNVNTNVVKVDSNMLFYFTTNLKTNDKIIITSNDSIDSKSIQFLYTKPDSTVLFTQYNRKKDVILEYILK